MIDIQQDEESNRSPARRASFEPPGDRTRLEVLAEVSRLLASSADHLTILQQLTELVAPALADCCVVHITRSLGYLERIVDSSRIEFLELLSRTRPEDATVPDVARVFESGQGQLCELAPGRWHIAVPVIVQGRVTAVLSLVRADSGFEYGRDDLAFAEELAGRVAMFVDNKMLRRELQQRESTLGDQVKQLETRNHELLAALESNRHDLDQFVYVASHDLRAPLRGIANLSTWVEEDASDLLPDRSREYLTLLRGRVRRLEDLIEGVLDYSRAGRVSESPIDLDVGSLVREVVELLAVPETARVEIDAGLPTLRTTRVPLQQVFMNLVGNALKYNGKAAPVVEVGAEPIAEGWEFFVRDNGPGIARRFHHQIWGLFQTLQSRDLIESPGVGLAIVRRIVEAHGGRAWIDSDEGQGATFRFTWPHVPPPIRSWDRHPRTK